MTDLDLWEQEFDDHLWSHPALERAVRGEHVTPEDLQLTWQQIAMTILLFLVIVAVGVLLGWCIF